MARTRKGNAAELGTMEILHEEGYVVALRRHWKGPGDVLAVRGRESLLIEVKGTAQKWKNFEADKRQALSEYAAQHPGMKAVYAWWPPLFAEHVLFYEEDWPT